MSQEPSRESDHKPPDGARTEASETRTAKPQPAPRPTVSVIGPYRVKRIIATGGMGTVYEAIQKQPRRTVAVKVMKRGIASRSALRRFEYEAQILARLKHPGIAQIYEAGTHQDDSGTVPYFAMEYIPNAKPITEFVKDRKLGTRERMELFTQVCDAVQHGHRKGVIHRDLKPSNILVDSSERVKIIDFGVARCTDSDMAITTLQTDVGQLIGTLQYMSPEQCEADPHDIDTRSDVYALGVVFFELLTGQLPYDVQKKAIHEATRLIREAQPTRLSTLNRTLRGDVETIALKALEKDRRRRYQSAADVAEDIARYLAYKPIHARPPSVVYRLRKFARRRRIPVATCIAVLVAICFAADRQIRATWTDSQMRTLRTAYDVFYAAQPDETFENSSRIINDCTRAIALDPTLALAYALRAKAHTLRGDNVAAWQDCNKAVELEPDNALVQRTLAYLHLERGDYAQATEAYERGFQKFMIDTDLPRDLHNYARACAVRGDYDVALRFYDGAVALAPSAYRYVSRALARRFAGDVEGAIRDLDRATSLDPVKWNLQPKLWIWEMRMLRNGLDDHAAAEAALAEAERAAATRSPPSPFERSVVRMIRGDSDAAAALTSEPNPMLQCGAQYYLGVKALVDGQAGRANELFRKVIKSGVPRAHAMPEFDQARWHLEQAKDR